MAKKTPQARGSSAVSKRASAAKKAPADKVEALSSTAEFEALLKGGVEGERRYVLKLYVTGTTARAAQAVANIHALCDEHLAGRYDLEVIDIYQQPDAAALEQIIAAPTLVKESPLPARRVVGNLSDTDKVLISLNIQPEEKDKPADEDETRWMKL